MRILRLPYLCILEIIESWNLFELYKFSALSKRATVIAKLKKYPTPEKAIISTRLGYLFPSKYENHEGFSLILKYSERVRWFFGFTSNERLSQNHIDDPCRKRPIIRETRTFFFRNHVQDGLQFADFLINLFNVSVAEIEFHISEKDKTKDIESIVEWINNQNNLKIMESRIFARNNDLLPMIVQKYKKKTELFYIRATFEGAKPDPTLIFSPELELDSLCVPLHTSSVHGMSLDFLLSSNFPRIDMGGKSMTCQDINTFLHNWKNGKTNSKLKYCKLRMFGRIALKTVLKGLMPVVQEPNITKNVVRYLDMNFCVYRTGIQRIDGKCANFRLETYWRKVGEDAEIHQEVSDEHEDPEELKKDGVEKDGFRRKWYITIRIE